MSERLTNQASNPMRVIDSIPRTTVAAACFVAICLSFISTPSVQARQPVQATVAFDRPLQTWDGFGINYVETAQTPDYAWYPQEYGGFSLLSEAERREILDMVFGEQGLRPGIIKMFYDPFHQAEPDGRFDHDSSTRWLRYFAREGLEMTRKRGDDLKIITTMYGPPAWATNQKFLRGRDLDPTMTGDLVEYLVDWVRYLREVEGLPVRYLSLHNEGEAYNRWPEDGSHPNWHRGHDYNMWWPVEQVTTFIPLVRQELDAHGLTGVGVTPGETTHWAAFEPYGKGIAADAAAVRDLGLITSHGFRGNDPHPAGIEAIRAIRPELHAWVTSMTWGKESMSVNFLRQIHNHLYTSKVNAVIPWAGFQRPPLWRGGDPNPGTAFYVYEDGSYAPLLGYYLYRQVAPIGQPGMAVASTSVADPDLHITAFAANGSGNPDAFMVINESDSDRSLSIRITGTAAAVFTVYRTRDDGREKNAYLDDVALDDGAIRYMAPARSATTFVSR